MMSDLLHASYANKEIKILDEEFFFFSHPDVFCFFFFFFFFFGTACEGFKRCLESFWSYIS